MKFSKAEIARKASEVEYGSEESRAWPRSLPQAMLGRFARQFFFLSLSLCTRSR